MTTIVTLVTAGKPQKPTAPSLESRVFVALLIAADRLSQQAEQMMKQHSLTGTQYNVLRILRGAEPHGLPCKGISDRMISHDPDMTRLLDRLEKRGLISRVRQLDDRRVVKTRISAQGLEILRKLDAPVEELHRRQFRNIAVARLKSLAAALEEVPQTPKTRNAHPKHSPKDTFKLERNNKMGQLLAKFFLAATLAATLAVPSPAATTTWQIDPAHTAAGFSVKHMMIATVRGQFKGVTGTVNWDDQDIDKSTVDVTIDAKTVDTGEPKRDADLKSPNFLDVAHLSHHHF